MIGWNYFVGKLIPSGPAPPVPASATPGTQVTADAIADAPRPAVVQIAVQGGLVKRLSDADGELNWVVNGEQLQPSPQSAIPASTTRSAPT